jgi:hypothetical protein
MRQRNPRQVTPESLDRRSPSDPLPPTRSYVTPKSAFHVNFIWRSVVDVIYELLDPVDSNDDESNVLEVRCDDEMKPIARCLILKTVGTVEFVHRGDVAVRCDSFHYRGCCTKGVDCWFAHLVTLGDPAGPVTQGRFRSKESPQQRADSSADDPQPTADEGVDDADGVHLNAAAPGSDPRQHRRISWWFHDPYTGNRVPTHVTSRDSISIDETTLHP